MSYMERGDPVNAIIEFFTGIADAVSAAFSFLFGLIADIVYLVQLTGKFLAQLPLYFSWIPGELLALIMLIFTIVVLYKVLGREG